jgi:endonuclease G, mitochondrial
MTRNNDKKLLLLLPVLIKLLWKNPILVLIVLLLGGGWYGYQGLDKETAQIFKGLPQAQSKLNTQTWGRVLENQAFTVGYSDKRGNPLWVAYKLTPVPDRTPSMERPTRFTTDKRASNQVKHGDYDKSGYDRGHMAPNYAISALYGKKAQLETFLMTNITPQKPNLNRKIWQRLEEVEVKYFTRLAKTIWVTTGTVFDDKMEHLKTAPHVQIPTAFFKLYAMQAGGKTYLLAFLMPQTVNGNEPLDQYVVTVDTIEALTGLDFFHELDDKEETALESTLNTQPWQLTDVSRLPSRY